jgi:hypothetical protein
MTWSELDWPALDRLRDGFLGGSAAAGPYWRSHGDLANYDFTFGERIGWKWDAALRELTRRGWTPPSRTLLDWGCGSGIAGRRVLGAFGAGAFDTLRVWDHSALAREFACAAAREKFPALAVAEFDPRGADAPIGTLVLSHVLNELSAAARAELLALIERAEAVIWVEPGTHVVARDLAAIRDRLRERFAVAAPCTHACACPLFAAENARHWCHFFAPAPAGIYADSDWVKFGQRAGVDLRALPYAWLVLERKDLRAPAAPLPADASRVLGRASLHKAHATLLSCDATGLHELTLRKRADPALFKQLDRRPPIPLYRWQREGDKIVRAETLCGAP